LELLEKYRVGGIEQINPEIFSVSPFQEMGGAFRISGMFGGVDNLGSTLKEIQKRINSESETAS